MRDQILDDITLIGSPTVVPLLRDSTGRMHGHNTKGRSTFLRHSRFFSANYGGRHRRGKTFTNLIYFNEVDKSGHFAVWEQPELFASEVRAAFRSIR